MLARFVTNLVQGSPDSFLQCLQPRSSIPQQRTNVPRGVVFQGGRLVVALDPILGALGREFRQLEQVLVRTRLLVRFDVTPPGSGEGKRAREQPLGEHRVDKLAEPSFRFFWYPIADNQNLCFK
jgi:hypothetical protein